MALWKCCFLGCYNPAISEYLVVLKDEQKSKFSLPYCEKHVVEVTFGIKEQARKLTNIKELKDIKNLNLKQVEFPGVSLCLEEELPKESKTIKVVDSWEWIDDYGYWMNSQGIPTLIKKLETEEIENAALLIRKSNIQKITKKIEWIRYLEEMTMLITYEYPEGALIRENQDEVYAKLEQFNEVLAERGLLP